MVFNETIKDNDFSEAIFALSTDSLVEINGVFGQGEGVMAFHQVRHSIGVQQRARKIIKIFVKAGFASYEDLGLATIAGSHHDIIQHFVEKEVGEPGSPDRRFGKMVRKRLAGRNEKESAEFAVARMRDYNKTSGKKIFTPLHCQIVHDAIMATVPSFMVVGDGFGTVYQPALTSECHPVTRAVAMADIGTCAMDPEAFTKEGDQIFIEENPYMKRVKFEEIDLDAEQYYREQMLRWCRSQIGFIKGRKLLFESEIAGLPPEVQSDLCELFCLFDETIELQQRMNAEREKMSTYKLWRMMGFGK